MAQGFSLVVDPDATVYRNYTIVSQAYTIGDAVDVSRTAADVTPATASSTTVTLKGVAMQTVAATATVLLVCLVSPRQQWTCDTTNNSNAAHNYQRMILTDKATVNNTGTDSTSASAVIEQQGIVGPVANKRIVGRFVVSANLTA